MPEGSRNVHSRMSQAPADERSVCLLHPPDERCGDSGLTLVLVCLEEGPCRRELTVLVGKKPMCSVSQLGTDLGKNVLKVITYAYPARVGDCALAEFFKKFVCILCTVEV